MDDQERSELIERLADRAHQAWCGWMEYMFKQGHAEKSDNHLTGAWVMPREKVERWTRQMITPYAQLPESEKESDRNEARKYLEIMEGDNAAD